ncbi:MAG: tetratricopeptide repeat protein [Planctomycetaceae bacterium]
MSAEPAAPSSSSRPRRAVRRGSPIRRLLTVLLGIPLATGLLLMVWLWWAERPLKEVEGALAREDFRTAIERVETYLKRDPRSSRALDLKAQALVGLRKYPDALSIYERVGSDTIAGQRAWGEALLRMQRWTDALPLLRQVQQKQPDNADVTHELAACAMQAGEFEEAVKLAGSLSQLPGQRERGLLLLGVLQSNHGNYRLASEAFGQLLESNPDGSGLQILPEELFQGMGQACLNDGKPNEAIQHLTRSIEFRPSAERYAFLGEAWELQGDLAQAADAWKKGIVLDADLPRAREGLARVALDERQPAQAIEWLQPLSVPGKLTSSIAHTLKRASSQLGDKQAADHWDTEETRLRSEEDRKRALDDVVKQAPQSFWALALRAHKFASEGNRQQAATLLRTIEGLRTQKPDGYKDPQGFLDKLRDAVQSGSPLPALDLVPLERK